MRVSLKGEVVFKPTALRSLASDVMAKARGLREPVQAAMALRFHACVMANFGATGLFRPWLNGWAPLSPRYAKKVGRPYATLLVTGRLMHAVKVESNPGKATVVVRNADAPYATAHQLGRPSANLPARAYFPIETDGRIYPEVERLCLAAGHRALARALAGSAMTAAVEVEA